MHEGYSKLDGREAEFLRLYAEGKHDTAIAAEFNVCRERVSIYRKALGLPKRPGCLTTNAKREEARANNKPMKWARGEIWLAKDIERLRWQVSVKGTSRKSIIALWPGRTARSVIRAIDMKTEGLRVSKWRRAKAEAAGEVFEPRAPDRD